ncbi:TetR/AcrR family transcriptional regulator [Mycobacteroides abscessus]|uniref:TetR/AcrR family transcriptional regulator n=1 Tax=Mycobacteroides abscessus TaxID=36809 RepID=UPI00092754ED|nr:TetR/AcrR family transcriptional regulator [Mycobacteroides abscessus]MDM2692265.1 TetR/AcrR family transcriptional regulator [Mycobacteroides abscessus]SHV41671.1 transcriptional regulator [Mycobacteroides abscessus subsp. abscessus]SHX01282.1 transcriptional regulator [Mycobacteroides abscessus subsp. abscessus]SHX49295.1 transcriptional regulator [Mycobacteroides abscessus subsp. abscessus]SHZ45735.1 transcriptional regulator [Mycobacteroides abscessus subsp. abscessus]
MAIHTSPLPTGSGNKEDADRSAYRQRLLQGLETALTGSSFQQITIADIVRFAHTSRRTFYENFESKEACLLELHRQASQDETAHTTEAVDRTAPWHMQLRQATEAWISFVDARPAIMLSWIRDLPLLGEAARRLQRDGADTFISTIQDICRSSEFRAAGGSPISRERALVLVGGMERLAAEAAHNDRKLANYTEEAVQAALALMAPQLRYPHQHS